jgi:hypothetical protein
MIMSNALMKMYIENPDGSVREADMTECVLYYSTPEGERSVRVGLTQAGEYEISTVFMKMNCGLQYDSVEKGKPLLYETMVFDGEGHDVFQNRYYTRREAEIGHHMAVDRFQKQVEQEKASVD